MAACLARSGDRVRCKATSVSKPSAMFGRSFGCLRARSRACSSLKFAIMTR